MQFFSINVYSDTCHDFYRVYNVNVYIFLRSLYIGLLAAIVIGRIIYTKVDNTLYERIFFFTTPKLVKKFQSEIKLRKDWISMSITCQGLFFFQDHVFLETIIFQYILNKQSI